MDSAEHDPAPRLRRTVSLAAAVVLGITVLLLPGSGRVQVAVSEPEAVPLARGGPAETVFAFWDDLAAGDVAAATQLVADAPSPLALPGLPFRFLPEAEEGGRVRAALAFFTAVIDADVVGCRTAGATVTCDARIESDFARAVGVGGRLVPVAFTVDGGAITSILRDGAGAPALVGYCNWVKRTAPELPLFDADCIPATFAGAASHQRRLAAEFVAAGRPVPGYGDFHPLWNRW